MGPHARSQQSDKRCSCLKSRYRPDVCRLLPPWRQLISCPKYIFIGFFPFFDLVRWDLFPFAAQAAVLWSFLRRVKLTDTQSAAAAASADASLWNSTRGSAKKNQNDNNYYYFCRRSHICRSQILSLTFMRVRTADCVWGIRLTIHSLCSSSPGVFPHAVSVCRCGSARSTNGIESRECFV